MLGAKAHQVGHKLLLCPKYSAPRRLCKIPISPMTSQACSDCHTMSTLCSGYKGQGVPHIQRHNTVAIPTRGLAMTISEDNSSFTAQLPGWAMDDLGCMLSELHQPWYLRTWRVLTVLDLVRESAKKQGYLDIMKYEETHYTYFKCIDLERLISVKSLDRLGGAMGLPYSYPITVTSRLGRIGKTSFQLDHVVKAAETDEPLFESSVVSVSVRKDTREVDSNPDWWVKKYGASAINSSALRVNIKGKTPGKVLSRSTQMVKALDLDYYGHANNNAYFQYAFDALLTAFYEKKLSWVSSAKSLEGSIKKIELDFVLDSSLGDALEARVFSDEQYEKLVYCELYKGDKVIYIQSFLLDPEDTLQNKL